MRKILWLFLLFDMLLSSDNIEILSTNVKILNFDIEYAHNNDNSILVENINKVNFKKTKNQNSFGVNHNITWYKLDINNSSNFDKTIYLHNDIAYMSKEIDIFEFSKDKIVDQNRYKLFDEHISNKLTGSTLVYPILLFKNSSKTIYIKNTSLIHQLIDLKIYDKYNSIKSLINKNLYSIILVAILFALAIYNIMLFFLSRRIEFAYYSLYLINASLGLVYMYGIMFHNLNVYGMEAYWFNLTAIMVSLFLSLFVKSIFDTKKTNKKIDLLLNTIIYFTLINLLVAIFVDLFLAMKIVALLFSYTFITLIYVGIYFYKRKHPLSKVFLLANIVYIIGLGGTMASLMGFLPYTFLMHHLSGIGLVIEALLFSYLLHFRIKLLEQEITRHQKSLLIKNKKAQLGDMIGAITHQWKQPLTAISSVSTVLQYRLDNKGTISNEYLKLKLLQINDKVQFLIETINDFKYFFNPKRINEKIDVADIINRAISLSSDDMLAENICVKKDLNFTKSIDVYPNELLHIILNLMQNSKEAFMKLDVESKIIKIIGVSEEGNTIIDIIDNAGGIAKEELAKIFDEFYTTKEKNDGSGLGLYLTRFILKEHMNGSIDVKQIENGTIFRIILNDK